MKKLVMRMWHTVIRHSYTPYNVNILKNGFDFGCCNFCIKNDVYKDFLGEHYLNYMDMIMTERIKCERERNNLILQTTLW